MDIGPQQVLEGEILNDESPLFEDIQECSEEEIPEYVTLLEKRFPGYDVETINRTIIGIRNYWY